MDKDYWDSYYASSKAVHFPSSFCEYSLTWIPAESRILELGCGNGRDAFFLAERGYDVIGIDQSDVAIQTNIARSADYGEGRRPRFMVDDFSQPDLSKYATFRANVVYSRFTLHSITEAQQAAVLSWVFDYLPQGGLFAIECRTNNDPLLEKGRRISATEAVTDHYRRFLDANAFLLLSLNAGFKARYFIEANNLAIFGDDNPVVARFVLGKP
jgi:tellurite methyltransferase